MLQLILQATSNWFTPILEPLLAAIGALLTSAISYGFYRLGQYLKAKIRDEKLQKLIDHVLGFTEDIVITINQTYVDDLVKQGKFSKEAQKQAFNKALVVAKTMINEEGKELLEQEFGSLEAWLTVVIESRVKEVKDWFGLD